MKQLSLWDILPNDIQNKILCHRAINIIQRNAIKMFYNKYGITWKNRIKNFDRDFDYFLSIRGINDSFYDYYNLYRY
tara:strand:- start:47 stop:277 length:231 start_codon:yes stop_codon:yes gene_type:complete